MMAVKQLQVGMFCLSKWAAVLLDAIGDMAGCSLPFAPKKVTESEHLNQLINANSVESLSGQVSIRSVELLAIPSVSSNCNNVVVTIKQPVKHEILPNTLFIKLPSPSLITCWFFAIIGSWKLEAYFFKHVAAQVPLRTPKAYGVITKGTRFVLIQENLHADPKVQLFTNPDMLAGPSVELVHRCLDAFAELHASHYGLGAKQREAILPMDQHPFLSPTMRVVSQMLNKQGLKPCLKKYPHLLPEAVIDSYQKTLANWDLLLEVWFSGPLSLIHGDSHLGNFFIDGDRMGMLDWQAVHWGNGIRDVQYFLIDSLPVPILQDKEQELLAYYVERRAHYGAAIDYEQSWQQYRGFSYHTLMTIVVSIGFGAMNKEQDLLMEEILKRAVAAIQRVDYAGWLEQQLSSKQCQ